MKTSNGDDEAIERSQGESRGGTSGSVSEQPIRFADSVLGEKRHICAFFNSPDEEYQVLLPFIKAGFERGDKASHIVDPQLREEHQEGYVKVRSAILILGYLGIRSCLQMTSWKRCISLRTAFILMLGLRCP
jgi:hypothetical protein